MHTVPNDAVVTRPHHREPNGESESAPKWRDKQGEDFAAFFCIWDVANATVTTKLIFGFQICSWWEAVLDLPRVNVFLVACTRETFLYPCHWTGWLIACLYAICEHAGGAVEVAFGTKLAFKALEVKVVILTAIHKHHVVKSNAALTLFLPRLGLTLFTLVVDIFEEIALAYWANDFISFPPGLKLVYLLLNPIGKLIYRDRPEVSQCAKHHNCSWLFLWRSLVGKLTFYRSVLLLGQLRKLATFWWLQGWDSCCHLHRSCGRNLSCRTLLWLLFRIALTGRRWIGLCCNSNRFLLWLCALLHLRKLFLITMN